MANLTQTIPDYLGGVSKFPDDKKELGELKDCLNGYPDPTFGLTKRPGFKHIITPADPNTETEFQNAKWFHIHRDGDETYIGCLKLTSTVDVRIWNVSASPPVECTVTDGTNALNYLNLNGASTFKDFEVISIQDTTVITNKKAATAMVAASTFVNNAQATVKLPVTASAGLLANTTYAITLTKTDGSSIGTASEDSGTNTIHTLLTNLTSDLNALTGVTAVKLDTSIEITFKVSGVDTAFNITCTAGTDDTGIEWYQDEVQVFTTLPERSKHGRIVRVLNSDKIDEDDYYLKFEGNNNENGIGKWVPTISPSVSVGFNAATMPHELINTAENQFTFRQITWDERGVGDDTTNPKPTFVTKTIQQTFIHNNRLGFLSKDNIIFSQAGDFYNFFKESAQIQIASDPIDVNVSSVRPVVLHGAKSTPAGLILFSKDQQFLLSSIDGPLTPTSVEVKSISNFEMDPEIDPVDMGTNLIFVSKTPGFTRIYSLSTQGRESNPQVDDIGKTVSEWIPETVNHVVTSPQNSFVALYGTTKKDVYFYRTYSRTMAYYNPEGRDQILNAWFRWGLPGEVQFIAVDSDLMYAVTTQGGRTTLLSASINQTPEETILVNSNGEKINPCMDLYAIAKSAPYQAMDTLTITTAGNGWTSAPTITLTPTQTGEGSGATATCTIATVGGTAGVVNAVTITAVGSGYSQGIKAVVGTPWAQNTAYDVGDQVVANNRIYTCATATGDKKSAESGTGPSGDTNGQTDDNVTWNHAGVQTVVTPTVYDGTKCYIPFKNEADLTPVLTVGSDASEIEDGADFIESGFTVEPTRGSDDTGEYFSVFDKDLSAVADKVVLGYSYIYDLHLPRTYFRSQAGSDFSASLIINRYKFSIGLAGVVGFKLKPVGGTEWTDVSSTIDAQTYLANDVPLEDQSVLIVPIHQRNLNFTLRIYSESPFPVSLTSSMWEGNYSPRFYRRA